MYRVQGTMRDNYYADEDQPRRTNLVSGDGPGEGEQLEQSCDE